MRTASGGRGCHEAQGYLLSRPLSAAELEQRYLRGLNRRGLESMPETLGEPLYRSRLK